jgi:predicted metal-binding membrane protein
MMSPAQVLSRAGLIKTSRRRGFCPACRLFQTGDGPQEIAAPALVALAFLIVAVLAWVWTIARMSAMDDMAMGLGSFGPFVVTWTAMMAAMMLPTAMPLVFEFAQHAERRRRWRIATVLLGATYLGVWLVFGVVCYLLYNAVGMPWSNQRLIGGAVLVIAGLYALTPVKRASEALCRERCALHGPLPFNMMRSAVVAGARYGLSCLGCSAGLMTAMVLIGMTSMLWMIALSAAVLLYKLAPAPTPRVAAAASAVLVALGALYAVTG